MIDYYCGRDKVEAVAEEFGVTVPATVTLQKPAKEYPSIMDACGENVPRILRLQIDEHGQYRIQHD